MRSAHRPEPWITTTGVLLPMASAAVARVFSPPSSIKSTTGTCTPAMVTACFRQTESEHDGHRKSESMKGIQGIIEGGCRSWSDSGSHFSFILCKQEY